MTRVFRCARSVACASLAFFPVAGLAATWDITEIDGATAVNAPELSFAEDGGLAARTGCNQILTGAEIAGDNLIKAGPIISTRAACTSAELDAQEKAILGVLGAESVALRLDPFANTLTLTGGGLTLVLVPQIPVMDAPEEMTEEIAEDAVAEKEDEAMRPAPAYDAEGTLSCRLTEEAAPQDCAYGLRSIAKGAIEMDITLPDGDNQTLVFLEGVLDGDEGTQSAEGDDITVILDAASFTFPASLLSPAE